MTDEKKPRQGAVKGGQRKKLTKSERQALQRLDSLKIAPASILDDRLRLAYGRLCEGVGQLLFVTQEPDRDIKIVKGWSRSYGHLYVLRRRVERVTERLDLLEALFTDPDDSF